MKKEKLTDTTAAFEAAIEKASKSSYILRLYVAGNSPRSRSAIESIHTICEEHLKGRYKLEVIDIYQQPSLARGEQIIATPTLVKSLPAPLRKIIGDLTKEERVLFGLDLIPVDGQDKPLPPDP